MAFQIKDNDEVFNVNQAIWFETDINAIVAAILGDGVVSGCAVTAQGSPDMTVAVASGVVRVAGVQAAVASGNVTITAADGTNPRIDLIVVSNAGVKSATAGTAAANPKAPDIPASSVLLAMVYVPASDTTIASNQITDKRLLLNNIAGLAGTQSANQVMAGPASGAAAAPAFRALTPADGGALPYTRLKIGATVQIGVPNLGVLGTATRVLNANRLYLEPFPVYETLTIDTIQFEVTAAGAAAKVARVGIYAIDGDANPTTLIIDAGTALVDSTGIRTVTLGTPQALTPGYYAFALVSDGTPTLRVQRFANPVTGANNSWSATAGLSVYYANFTFGALTASPALTGTITAASGYEHSMQCSVSTT